MEDKQVVYKGPDRQQLTEGRLDEFEHELQLLLNRYSLDNGSNTPDFILASYLRACLETWNLHTRERDRWYGNRSLLGPGNDMPAVAASEKSLLR